MGRYCLRERDDDEWLEEGRGLDFGWLCLRHGMMMLRHHGLFLHVSLRPFFAALCHRF